MINMIGEAAAQQGIHARSIGSGAEILEKGDSARTGSCADEPTRNQTELVGGKVIIESYTKDGKLVKITPPGYLPLDKTV